MMQKLKLIAVAALAVLVLVVVWQNRQPVESRFLFATFTMSQAVLLLVTLATGFVLGVLTAARMTRKSKKQ